MTDAPKAIPEDLGTAHAPVRAAPWGDGKTPKAHNIFCDEHEITIAQAMTPEMAEYVAGLINAHGMGDMIMRTHSDALVAAAYEDAATLFDPKISEANHQEFSLPHVYAGDQAAIRQRTPANAQAAYDAAIAQARREGWEAGRDAAAVTMQPYLRSMFSRGEAYNTIQALEYKEPET